MPDHHAHHARRNHGAVDHSVGSVPLAAGKVVDRRRNVLIAFVPPVPGEMLTARRHAVLLQLGHIRHAHATNALGIRAERAGVGNRIAPVVIDVNDRRKGPVRTDCRALCSADLAQPSRLLGVVGRGDRHGTGKETAVRQKPVSARFEIGADEHRNMGILLQRPDCAQSLLCGNSAAHDPPGTDLLGKTTQILFVVAVGDKAEQLAQAILGRHGSQCVLHPIRLLPVQPERGSSQPLSSLAHVCALLSPVRRFRRRVTNSVTVSSLFR